MSNWTEMNDDDRARWLTVNKILVLTKNLGCVTEEDRVRFRRSPWCWDCGKWQRGFDVVHSDYCHLSKLSDKEGYYTGYKHHDLSAIDLSGRFEVMKGGQ